MEIRELIDTIQSHLQLSARVHPESIEGKVINVGETFIVTFEVKNISYTSIRPRYNFKNIKLFLEETQYAELVKKTTQFNFKMDDLLRGQQTISIDVEYKAFANIGGLQDLFEKELVTEAFIEAELDLPSFFTITQSIMVNTEIEEN